MGRILLITTCLLLVIQLKAQQYDTYGRSRATREWQETERHYNSMKSGNKTSSSTISGDYNSYGWADNSRIRSQNEAAKRQEAISKAWSDKEEKLEKLITLRNLKRQPAYFYKLQIAARDAGFNDFEIYRFFGDSEQDYEDKLLKSIRVKYGVSEADRVKGEFEKSMELVRKEKLIEQKRRDDLVKVEIAQFQKNWNTATSVDYGLELRQKAFQAMHDYLHPILEKSKMSLRNYPSVGLKLSVTQGESSMTQINRNKNKLYTQSKQFELAYKNGNINTIGLSKVEITNCLADFVYAGLIFNKSPNNVIIEKAAISYKQDSSKLIHIAYSLFLDHDLDACIDILENHIKKYPIDTINGIGNLNKLILLKLLQKKEDEALNIYNKNSSMFISTKDELIDFITYFIYKSVKKSNEENESLNYYIYPLTTLMDLDIIAALQPLNESIQESRKELGQTLQCQRFLSPIKELWTNEEKKNSNSSIYLDQLIANSTTPPELKDCINIIGFPLFKPEKEVYEKELSEIREHNMANGGDQLVNIQIKNGYIYKTRSYSDCIIYKLDDLELPILQDKVVNIKLKQFKYAYEPTNFYPGQTSDSYITYFYDSKSKAKKGFKMISNLFEKLLVK